MLIMSTHGYKLVWFYTKSFTIDLFFLEKLNGFKLINHRPQYLQFRFYLGFE